MAKCVRCGRGGMGVLHQAVKLNDGNLICFKCYKELGYDPKADFMNAYLNISWNAIKDGREAEVARIIAETNARADADGAAKYGILPKHYRQLDETGSTDNEMKIFAAISAILEDEGCDVKPIDIALNKERGSLLLWLDGVLIIEYKSEPNVKWIVFPHESYEKIRIGGVGRMNSLAPKIVEAYKSAL